jgi:hypothetical protein
MFLYQSLNILSTDRQVPLQCGEPYLLRSRDNCQCVRRGITSAVRPESFVLMGGTAWIRTNPATSSMAIQVGMLLPHVVLQLQQNLLSQEVVRRRRSLIPQDPMSWET